MDEKEGEGKLEETTLVDKIGENSQATTKPEIKVAKVRKLLAGVPRLWLAFVVVLMVSNSFTLGYILNSRQKSDSMVPVVNQPDLVDVVNQAYPTYVPDYPSLTPTLSPTPTIARVKSAYVMGEVTWLDQPVKMAKLPVLIESNDNLSTGEGLDTTSYSLKDAYFYQVGTTRDGSKLIYPIIIHSYAMAGENINEKILVTADNKYLLIRSSQQTQFEDEIVFLPELQYIVHDFPELAVPETLTVNGLLYGYDYYEFGTFFSALENPQEIGDSPAGKLYQTRKKLLDLKDLYARMMYLRLKDNTVAVFTLKNDLFSDEMMPNITWTDGRSAVRYQSLQIGGCGRGVTGTPIIVDHSTVLSGLVAVGKTKSGQDVYQLKDANNELVKFLFKDAYSQYRENPLSINEYAAKPNHFLWQDPLGDWQFYINQDYALLAECAKPVIYLYPESETNVSVKVGASIRESDPKYPANGWNVTANSKGEIYYQGQEYPYLFWDGVGNGVYPDLSARGTVVAKSQVEQTIRQQLAAQGLSENESNDFLEFWLPLMPDKPYVRLTWLTREEMNRLAPLDVNPRPDSAIRVFLDFEGLDKFVNLNPDKFVTYQRNGFTLVEWGGLRVGEK